MSSDDDQLKAKIGQILYNNYITDRLREEVMQRVAHRNSLALRMNLGRDSSGDEVYLDILVNRVRPEIEELKRSVGKSGGEFPTLPDTKKFTAIILSSEGSPSSDNLSMATNFEYLMSQSLNWWARYAGSRDNLDVDKWKIVRAYTVDSTDASLLAILPIDIIMVPESRKFDPNDGHTETRTRKTHEDQGSYLTTLPPVCVRMRENGRFELVSGYNILQSYLRCGRKDVPAKIVSISDEEAEKTFEDNRRAWERRAAEEAADRPSASRIGV